MSECEACSNHDVTISGTIGFCADCIRSRFDELWPGIKAVHDSTRRAYRLPVDPPRAETGVACPLCHNQCRIAEGEIGYCGVRRVEDGKLRGGRPHEGNLSFYHDPLPTNCVADFVCPAGTSCGYPQFSMSSGPEYGYRNLAVFYHACSFNCLYCQNFHYKDRTFYSGAITADQLAAAADRTTTCVCYFGGDPSPQILHALKASSIALSKAQHEGRILRICWETNGATQLPFLKQMARLSLESGGCIKFDIKGWDDGIHHALCGVSNKKTLENFRWLSRFISQRPDPPFLVASTLLVPGYVDEVEVSKIAEFIADLNDEIPYRLLAFHPEFILRDLPTTSRSHALRCREAAQKAGLKRISVGNVHLLADGYL